MPKKQPQPQSNSQQAQQDPQQNPPTLATYGLDQQEIEQALRIVGKIKKITKSHLTPLKQKHRNFNNLFGAMSSMFVIKKDKVLLRKQQRLRRIQARRKTTLCKKSQNFAQLLAQINGPQNNSLNQPQITQDNPQQQSSSEVNSSKESQLQQIKLVKPFSCHICLSKYTQIDDTYHQHCPTCAEFSKQKRSQCANLTGLTALVTGARIKIGYEITIKLLRDGATVYATTRFPKDALLRYQQQPDYQAYKSRLFLIQCDFLCSEQVTSLIKYIKEKVPHLDMLIHNAAQTIARPPQFYTFQLTNESKQIEAGGNVVHFTSTTYPSIQMQRSKAITADDSAGAKQIQLKHTDEFGQPLDLRAKNTWRQKIQEVSLFDCMSTQVINSTVPFYITGQLRAIMGGGRPSWVINVSSMEGVFYRNFKSPYHPHTNMAKASLNMMTRTCAAQMAKHGIYMSSVDTGWVTNQNPLHMAARMKDKHDFTPPLDCVEGAMRVLDPIYQGLNEGKLLFGKFFKNYQQSLW